MRFSVGPPEILSMGKRHPTLIAAIITNQYYIPGFPKYVQVMDNEGEDYLYPAAYLCLRRMITSKEGRGQHSE